MYGIIFSVDDNADIWVADRDVYDLVWEDLPKLFKRFGFERMQYDGVNFYIYRGDDMVAVCGVMNALRNIDWFRQTVTDIKAFKIEQWSDFTNFMQDFKEKI